MSGTVEVVVIVAAIGYVLVSRLMGRPAEAKRMLILPGVLMVIGLSNLKHITGQALLLLVGTAVVSVVIGALRGVSIKLYQRDGILFMRYTWVTVALWALNIAVKFGANLLFGAADNTLYATLGLGLLAEGVVVLAKAVRAEGQIVWSKGKDGAPHRTSPWLDDLQRRYSGRRQ